jgi:prepilin-type N-terminal cleavage/methylation domain-containing protein
MRRPRGMTLIELLVCILLFTLVVGLASRAIVQADRFFYAGTARTEQRERLERAARRLTRDVRNARRVAPAWGAWTSDGRTLLLEQPAESAEASGPMVIYVFDQGRLRRGCARRPGAPIPWADCLPDAELASVAFEAIGEPPRAVRVRVVRAPAGPPDPAEGHAIEWVAALR